MTMLPGYAHLVDFFTSFEWWRTVPRNDLVAGSAFCLAETGKVYVVYLPSPARVTLTLEPGKYHARWFNPRAGQWSDAPTASGPYWTSPLPPTSDGDWVVHLRYDPELTNAPTVIAVTPAGTARDLTHLWVTFSEPVESGSAQQPGNYVLNGGSLATRTAALQPDLVTVRLTIEPLTPLATNTLAILGVKDLASRVNLMSPTNWVFTSPPTNVPPGADIRFEEGAGSSATNSPAPR